MKTKLHCLLFGLLLTFGPGMAHAETSAQNLAVCLTDSLDGAERKTLAKWIYFGMSTHSTIQPYSKVLPEDMENMDKYVGGLITRLLTEDCAVVAKQAFQEGGKQSIEYGFQIVGQVAMKELMTEPKVTQALGSYARYLDQEKFNALFK